MSLREPDLGIVRKPLGNRLADFVRTPLVPELGCTLQPQQKDLLCGTVGRFLIRPLKLPRQQLML